MPLVSTLTRRIFLSRALACVTCLPARAGTVGKDGFRSLEARESSLQLHGEPAAKTPVLTYDGTVPGPLLRCRQGEEIALRFVNWLDQPSTVSLQGLRIPNAMAGIAGLTQPGVEAGASFDYRFAARESGLSWYHSHVLPRTREQVGRGLYGALIVDEKNPPVVDRDILVFLADWPFSATAETKAPPFTVNSLTAPLREILPPRSRVRLRIVSAVSAQVLPLRFMGAKPIVLAVDGAPCEPFAPARQTIPVGPGALYDAMLDLPPEQDAEVRLVSADESAAERVLAILTTGGEPRADLPPIAPLEPHASLPTKIKLEAAKRAEITIENAAEPGNWKLNGITAAGFPAKPLFGVKRGTPVSLGFVNRSTNLHQMRVHGHYMRILHDLDDGWEPYWRNTLLVPAGKTKRVAFIADAPGKWPIEGLSAESRSFGLATWFEVRSA
jgi:FtsP/CotA-like multicopper oxidase with cupredoxin domain